MGTMAPPPNETKDTNGRRKGLYPFSSSRSSSFSSAKPRLSTESNLLHKRDSSKSGKRASIFGLASLANTNLETAQTNDTMTDADRAEDGDSANLIPRPRTLSKQKGRPSSMFGSRGKRSMQNLSSSTPTSISEDMPETITVLYDGEVQTTSGLFRKKKEYLVLTDRHLVRFKSQSRAGEAYPSILENNDQHARRRHLSSASTSSMQDFQSNTSRNSADLENRIPLEQIVTAYKLEDGKPYFTTEVVYLDEDTNAVGSIQLMLHSPEEADIWISSIRGAAQKARLLMKEPYPERIVRHLVDILEKANDYDPRHCNIFRVVRRAPLSKGGRPSSDDLQKLGASVYYLVVGVNRLHLIPPPAFTPHGSLISTKLRTYSHGLVALVAMNVKESDDRFELQFRLPMKEREPFELAASATFEIASYIFRALRYLKPLSTDYNLKFTGPIHCQDAAEALADSEESEVEREAELGWLDRTLIAYCIAYACDPTNIRYSVDYQAEDAPEFRLLPPAKSRSYTARELLAVMRTLRYNTAFCSLSFRGIDLHSIHGLNDPFGGEYIAWFNLDNVRIDKFWDQKPDHMALLYQETQALALLCRTVRRMDFSNCLPRRRVRDTFDAEGKLDFDKDPGCEIIAGVFTVARSRMTSVTWIDLSGIELGETDLEAMRAALSEARAHFRAVECSRCGLTDSGIIKYLRLLEKQSRHVECLNISDNPGRLHLGRFQTSLSHFTKLRKLNLSRMAKTPGEETFFAPEVVKHWRLEELSLSGISLNAATLKSISDYLRDDMSDNLRILNLDRCNLNGGQVGSLMRSISREPGKVRELRLDVSNNGLEQGIDIIIGAIRDNDTPAHLIMRMIEFAKEAHFKQLLDALCVNNTIRCLDISQASLPYDAGTETCDSLKSLFIKNRTLEELDISGEQAHLEVIRFGIGLNQALTGLEHNTALKVLRIEYQNLGFEGANTLASVINKNQSLTHIQCAHNDIGLQAYTSLVNAMANNYTVIELPLMTEDQEGSIKRMKASMAGSVQTQNSVRRIGSALRVTSHSHQAQEMTQQDVVTAGELLGNQWESLNEKLTMFLNRNRAGYGPEDVFGEEPVRPTTSMSEGGILQHALDHTTPKAELGDPVDSYTAEIAKLSGKFPHRTAHSSNLELDPDSDTRDTVKTSSLHSILTSTIHQRGNIETSVSWERV